MEEYQYPLFFEAELTSDLEKERLWMHFQRRRDSGGGECGPIRWVRSNIYRIHFEKKEDQERVLQRKNHTVFLPNRKLHITMSRVDVPKNFTPTDLRCGSQSQKPSTASTKCLEMIFSVDAFILYYLRDNSKALEVLKKQFWCVGTVVELDFDDETVMVRGDVDRVPGSAYGNVTETWTLLVEKVFHAFSERHLCCHVTEPDVRRMLHADRSLINEDLKVYSEAGYDVIVGDAETVKRKVAILELAIPMRRELPIVEKHYELVEEEFKREMQTSCPQVKVFRGTGKVSLEGPDHEVQAGARKLEEVLQKIQVRRIYPCDDLMVFLEKTGALVKYQNHFRKNLGSRVLLEAGSDLVFSSLSSEALAQAEAILRSEVTHSSEKIRGVVAVPPELDRLKEILTKVKSDENRQEPRVGINFIPLPGTASEVEVLLVGYTDSVGRLKDCLTDFQMNQVQTREVLDLPDLDMVDDFDQIIDLIGLKRNNVKLEASPFPSPCVLVSGPQRLVRETLEGLRSALLSLSTNTLVLDGPGARLYFQTDGRDNMELVEASCQVIIRPQNAAEQADVADRGVPGPSKDASPGDTAWTTNKLNIKIKLGNLEDEKVDVLVGPMLNKKPSSTKIGQCLLSKIDKKDISGLFPAAKLSSLGPGGVLRVNGTMNLGCANVFFMECIPWDGVGGQSATALADGLKRCLELCAQEGFCSVAFPVIGPGVLLQYPPVEAIQVLVESLSQFAESPATGSLTTVHIVVRPNYPDSQCYLDIGWKLSQCQKQREVFKSLSGDLDDIAITLEGGLKLELVFGDITHQSTDAIVNAGGFSESQYGGVCRDIFALAGAAVETEVKTATIIPGDIYVSQPGLMQCQALLHVCKEQEPKWAEEMTSQIVEYCESSGFGSVAMPSICGIGVLDDSTVAGAMLRGVEAAASAGRFSIVNKVRIVLINISTFLAFKQEAMQSFSAANITRAWMSDLSCPQPQQPPPHPPRTDLSLPQSHTSQQSVFRFVGLCRTDVDGAMAKLKSMYEAQSSTHTFKKAEMESLTQEDTDKLQRLVESRGLSLEADPTCPGGMVLSGSKDGVNEVMQIFNAALRREVRLREEEELYARVAWCILGSDGNWERLPKAANFALERRELSGRIADAKGLEWTAQLHTMEATRDGTQSTKLKRLENLPDFKLPLHWDSMAADESLKVVTLQPSSAEYKRIQSGFKHDKKSVVKIERVQNVHLRRGYEVQKKCIADRNGGNPGEKLLYHGTARKNCKSIMNSGFDRGFAGQNATHFGHGCYFAVKAQYSAVDRFAKPDHDGVKVVFAARVLTGAYAMGHSNMKYLPRRGPQRPTDRYDSAVDDITNPSIFIIFHDSQAYPEYLITFK